MKVPRKTRKQKVDEVSQELINEMFRIAGHNVTFDDVKGRTDDWYTQWTITQQQNEEWKKFGVDLIRTKLKLPKKIAELEMAHFSLAYGLKFSEWY
jgi:hypothetical protein